MWASVDCVGGAATRAVSAATRPGGAVIVYGAMSGPTLQLNILDIFLQKRLQVLGLASSQIHDVPTPPGSQ